MAEPIRQTLGKYKIIDEIGRGASAVVYEARDTSLDRLVALKVMHPGLLWNPGAVERFMREAQAAAQLDHPNIVTIYEVGEEEGSYYIAMRYLPGPSVAGLIAEGPLDIERALEIAIQVADALGHAHEHGFIHRDVKPTNIILDSRRQAVVTDFGLVKALEWASLSGSGGIMGTPGYVAPEIWEGETATPATDVYGLGIVLWEMLAGQHLFAGDTPAAVMKRHLTEPPPSLDEVQPEAPQKVAHVVAQALSKAPDERYGDAGTFITALQDAMHAKEPARVREPSPPERPQATKKQVQVLEPELVHVPAGPFTMGSDDHHDDEKPAHTVNLPEYWIGKYPVTNAEYACFVQATDHPAPTHWEEDSPPQDKEKHPVVHVSWQDAMVYCQWLSEMTGKPYRLPTEAEWEKAARGTDGREYPWGDEWDAERCNAKGFLRGLFGQAGQATPVNAYPQGESPYGALDMVGNVWESTSSLKKDYPYQADDGREDPEASGSRVLRGGSWYYALARARCAYRHWGDPDNRHRIIGFRCCAGATSSL